jgi:hypothetical protein
MSEKFAAAFETDFGHRTPMAMGEKTCLPLTSKENQIQRHHSMPEKTSMHLEMPLPLLNDKRAVKAAHLPTEISRARRHFKRTPA